MMPHKRWRGSVVGVASIYTGLSEGGFPLAFLFSVTFLLHLSGAIKKIVHICLNILLYMLKCMCQGTSVLTLTLTD